MATHIQFNPEPMIMEWPVILNITVKTWLLPVIPLIVKDAIYIPLLKRSKPCVALTDGAAVSY